MNSPIYLTEREKKMLNAQTKEQMFGNGLPRNAQGRLPATLSHRLPSGTSEKRYPAGGIGIHAGQNTCQTQPVQGPPCDDEILELLKMTAHDLRGGIFNVGAALKLLKRGSFGNMETGVSQEIDKLFAYVTKLVGTLEDSIGRAFSLSEGLVTAKERIHLQRDVLDPVLDELSTDIQQSCSLFHNGLDAAPAEQLLLRGDRFWLKAVFRNLLKNAIKYGGRGVKLAVGFKNQGTHIRINIYNSGRPIPPECCPRLFTQFSHLTPSHDGKSNGLGLGLYLVKQAIERHGGKIWYEAKTQGSNFIFTLARG
jgi:signal transduction histidine kinase